MLEQNNNVLNFENIKGYVAKQLKETSGTVNDANPIVLFDSSRREVILKTFDPNFKGKKIYNIPFPQEREKFQKSWVDVFVGCLAYIKERLKREGVLVLDRNDNVIIGDKIYKFNSCEEYITILQKELENLLLEKKNNNVIGVTHQSIKISVPEKKKETSVLPTDINDLVTKRQLDELLKTKRSQSEPLLNRNNEYTETYQEPEVEEEKVSVPIEKEEAEIVKKKVSVPIEKEEPEIMNYKLSATFPRDKYSITKDTLSEYSDRNYDMYDEPPYDSNNLNNFAKLENDNIESNSEHLENTKNRKITNYKILKKLQSRFCGVITDDESLTLSDCSLLRDKPLVLVAGSPSKSGEIIFDDNIDLIKENIRVPVGAFINGKGTTAAKVLKEIKDINNMCKNNITSLIVCYEPNYELFEGSKSELAGKIMAVKQLMDILSNEYGYVTMICMSLDNKKLIDNFNISFNCPIILRVSSKELDNVNEDSDVVIMHPKFPYDQISLSNETVYYIQNAINKNLQNFKTSRSA